MSDGLKWTIFLDACKAKIFQYNWMSAQSWANLPQLFLRAELQLTGTDLVKAVLRSHQNTEEYFIGYYSQKERAHCTTFMVQLALV